MEVEEIREWYQELKEELEKDTENIKTKYGTDLYVELADRVKTSEEIKEILDLAVRTGMFMVLKRLLDLPLEES